MKFFGKSKQPFCDEMRLYFNNYSIQKVFFVLNLSFSMDYGFCRFLFSTKPLTKSFDRLKSLNTFIWFIGVLILNLLLNQ